MHLLAATNWFCHCLSVWQPLSRLSRLGRWHGVWASGWHACIVMADIMNDTRKLPLLRC